MGATRAPFVYLFTRLRLSCAASGFLQVSGQLGQVRNAQADRRAVGLAGVTGVVKVVVAGARRVQRVKRRTAERGKRGTVDTRVPEPDPVAERGVDNRGGTVELRRHETGAAPAAFKDGVARLGERRRVQQVTGVRVGVGGNVRQSPPITGTGGH